MWVIIVRRLGLLHPNRVRRNTRLARVLRFTTWEAHGHVHSHGDRSTASLQHARVPYCTRGHGNSVTPSWPVSVALRGRTDYSIRLTRHAQTPGWVSPAHGAMGLHQLSP